MMKKIMIVFLSVSLSTLRPAKADMWGADLVYLAQLVQNSIEQLTRLQSLLQNGRDSLNLLRDINRGINDSMQVVNSIAPYIDPGLYQNLRKLAQVATHIEGIYGVVAKSKDETAQRETDQAVAEAIHLNNSLYDYAKDLDQLGEEIKRYSHAVSPGGAQKLTAQTLGAMIHLQNQQLRASATGLKLSAQSLALQNKREKEDTTEFLRQSQVLKSAMSNPPKFMLPRF